MLILAAVSLSALSSTSWAETCGSADSDGKFIEITGTVVDATMAASGKFNRLAVAECPGLQVTTRATFACEKGRTVKALGMFYRCLPSGLDNLDFPCDRDVLFVGDEEISCR
jgi:hypothetical protein